MNSNDSVSALTIDIMLIYRLKMIEGGNVQKNTTHEEPPKQERDLDL